MRITDLAAALGGRLTLLHPGDRTREVSGVCLYEPGAAGPEAGRLVLMAGLGAEATPAGVGEAAASGAAGVVLGGPPAPAAAAAYRRVARTEGIAVFHRCADVSWLALADAVRDRLGVRAGGERAGVDESFGHRVARRRVLRALVETGELSRATAEELDLLPANGYLMIGLRRAGDPALTHAARNRLAESVDLYCRSYRWRAATTTVGHTIYCLLVFSAEHAPNDVIALAHGLAGNARRTMRSPMRVAVSDRRPDLSAAPELREQVDDVLAVLTGGEHAVRLFADAVPRILLDRFGGLMRAHPYAAYHKLAVLRRHDELHGTEHLRTLRVYLGAFGSVRTAAARLACTPRPCATGSAASPSCPAST